MLHRSPSLLELCPALFESLDLGPEIRGTLRRNGVCRPELFQPSVEGVEPRLQALHLITSPIDFLQVILLDALRRDPVREHVRDRIAVPRLLLVELDEPVDLTRARRDDGVRLERRKD